MWRLHFLAAQFVRSEAKRLWLPRVIVLLAAVISLGCEARPSFAETYLWKPVAIGAGGFITGYDADKTGQTRVARTDVHGAYLWLTEQNRWAQLATSSNMPQSFRSQAGAAEGVYEIVVAPSDPNRIFTAIAGKILRSDNRGETFFDVTSGLPPLTFQPNGEFRNDGPFMAVSPSDAALVVLGTPEKGLWRSADAGKTWAHVSSVLASAPQNAAPLIFFEEVAGKPTGRVWVFSAGSGFFVSSDEGQTFNSLSARDEPQPKSLTQGAFAPNGTFYGVDRQQSQAWRYKSGKWELLSGRNGLPSAPFVAVAVNPRTSQVFIFDQAGSAFRSNASGDFWASLNHSSKPGDGDPPWLRVSNQSYFAMGRVRFDPVVPDRLWAATGTGVYYADVSEVLPFITWISQSRGIEELVANDVAQPLHHAPLFAVLDFGVHLKDDLSAFSKSYGPKERVLIAVQQLATTPADPDFVATNASDTRTSCCWQDGDAVLAGYSTNAGRSWVKFGSLPTPPGTRVTDPWRMSFGTIAVSAGSADNIVWEPSFHRAPFYSLDRGATWHIVNFVGQSVAKGSHAQRFLQRKTLTADGLRPGVFYLAFGDIDGDMSFAGLWRTEDGGANWTQAFKGEIAPNSGYAAKLRAMPGRAGNLFFTSAVGGDGDTWLRRSIDGGATWTILRDVNHVDDIAFGKSAQGSDQPTIFISGRVKGQYGIWRSVDDAKSWVRIGAFPVGSLDQVTVVGADPDRFGRVYLGYLGSGFITGEPQPCASKPYHFPDATECAAAQ